MNIAIVIPDYGLSPDEPCRVPLGPLYVSAKLKSYGYPVKIVNENLAPCVQSDLVGQKVVMIAAGCYGVFSRVKELAQMAKAEGAKVVVGGMLPTFRPELFKGVADTVVVGEAEGVVLRSILHDGVVKAASPPHIDSLPWPDYEGFGFREYLKAGRWISVLSSRGCPFKCTFCAQSCEYRTRKMGDVLAEIDHYKAVYGVTDIIMNDNTLNVTKTRFLAFCDGMKGKGLSWSAAIRSDNMDEGMVLAAKNSGCRYLVVGVESFLQDRLDRMNKKTKVEDNVKTLDLLEKHGVAYHGNVIFGFDWDTNESMDREFDAMNRGYRVFPVLLQPFAGIAAKVGVTGTRREVLRKVFREYATSNGMNLYQEATPC